MNTITTNAATTKADTHNTQPAPGKPGRALALLRRHLQVLDGAHEELAALETRLAGYHAQAEAARSAMAPPADLVAQRKAAVLEVATGQRPMADLDAFDERLGAATATAARARRELDVAEAGAEHVQEQIRAHHARIRAAQERLAELRYQAGVELVSVVLEDYHAAMAKAAEEYSNMLGVVRAVETLADPANGRPFLGGHRLMTALGAPLPDVPGIDLARWAFDVTENVVRAEADTLRVLETGR